MTTTLYNNDMIVHYGRCSNILYQSNRMNRSNPCWSSFFTFVEVHTHTEDTVQVTIYNCQLVLLFLLLLLLLLLLNVNGFPTDAFIFIISTFPEWIKLQLPWLSSLHYSCSIGISSISRRAHRYSPNNTIAIIEQIWTIHQSQVAGKPS